MCDELRLPGDHAIEESAVLLFCLRGLRIVAGDSIVGQRAGGFSVASRGKILEGAHAEVAGCYTGKHGSGEDRFTQYTLAKGQQMEAAESK